MDPRLPRPQMREEFRRELRARLLAEANTRLQRPRGTAWSFLRPALGVALAAIVLMAGAGTAAAGSLPGDAAFGLKKVIEDVQVALTFDDVRRVQLLADIADRRLGELQEVADQNDKAPTASEEYAVAVERFRAAVDAMQQTAPQQKAEAAQQVADSARDKHETIVDELEQKVPEKAKPALQRARDEENRGKDKDRDKGDGKDKKDGGRGGETARPSRSPAPSDTPEPTRSPRPTLSPRGNGNHETPRPTPLFDPRQSPPGATDRPDGHDD